MKTMRKFKIADDERGLLFSDGAFQVVLDPGRHWFFDPLWKIRVERVSLRELELRHRELRTIVDSGALKGVATVAEIKAGTQAALWIDGCFEKVLTPGLYAFWAIEREVRVELADTHETAALCG